MAKHAATEKAGKLSVQLAEMAEGIVAGERAVLARAITLVESNRADHQRDAQLLIQHLLARTGNAIRIGITGVPGAGKSTLIDQFGINLVKAGHKVAVLAVDPSSSISGGSILGDKTRMPRLATSPDAFVRPSPSAGLLGGVARKTREAMLLLEAAGYDVVIVETVGIGQSETAVADMVDFFLVLVVPGTGDELQGIKKGVIEFADLIAVNKAEGENLPRANRAAGDYRAALHILSPASPNWTPRVITVSGQENIGLDELWRAVKEHHEALGDSGELGQKRRAQQISWLHALLRERMMQRLYNDPRIAGRMQQLEADVGAGRMTALLAAQEIMSLLEQ